jgi:hypothetical protein
MMRRTLAIALLVVAAIVGSASSASATIHPIVESFDCANEQAFAHHPLGDPADPVGQTPGAGQHSEQSSLRALSEVTDDFTDFSSPALSEHKLDGECGRAAP